MNKIILNILMIFCLTLSFSAECSEGCLRCSTSNQCEICDKSLFFQLRNGKCERNIIENCQVALEFGKCEICETGYYKNSTNFLCDKVSKTIEKCVIYLNENQCLECSPEYYQKDGNCLKVTQIIKDCALYAGPSSCSRCFNGLLNEDQTLCEDSKLDRNCAFRFFPQQCKKCKLGYRLDGIRVDQHLHYINEAFTKINRRKYKSVFTYENTQQCVLSNNSLIDLSLCQSPLFKREQCFECPLNQYYDEQSQKCIEQPTATINTLSQITNCFTIFNSYECTKCFEGFFMDYSKKYCLAHSTRVVGCHIMSQQIKDQCFVCEEDYYLNNNQCKPRNNKDSNCLEYLYNVDQCVKCSQGFSLATNGDQCLQNIENCEVQQVGENTIDCQKCLNDFYLESNSCSQVNQQDKVENCEEYEGINQIIECVRCSDNFRLLKDFDDSSIKKCINVNTDSILQDCLNAKKENGVYSCLSCEEDAILLNQGKICEVDDQKPLNCFHSEVIDGVHKCVRCNESFYLNTLTNTCQSAIIGCLYYAEVDYQISSINFPQCIICKANYVLVNFRCISLDFEPVNNCYALNSEGSCVLCDKDSFYRINIVENVNQDCRPKLYYENQFPHCVVIKDGQNLQCLSCEVGYFVDQQSGQCTSCQDNQCTFQQDNDQLRVLRGESSKCLIRHNGVCFGHYEGIDYFYENLQTPQKVMFLHSFNLYQLNQYPSEGFKLDYSPYYKYLFFADQSSADSNTISNATCVEGFARNYQNVSLTETNHDCLTSVKNCNKRKKLIYDTPERIYVSCRACFGNQVVHYSKQSILKSKMTDAIPNVTFDFLSETHQGDKLPSTFCYERILENSETITDTDIITNCALYEVSLDGDNYVRVCKACKPSYKMETIDDKIQCNEIQNCQFSNITSQCQKCEQNYSLFGVDQCVVKNDNFCLEVNQFNQCIKCIDGYEIDSITSICSKIKNKDCMKYEKNNCIFCRNQDDLSFQYKEKKLNSNVTCDPQTTQIQTKPAHCQLVDWKGFCVKCEDDYFAVMDGHCILKSSVKNCELYNPLNGGCFQCNQGHHYNPITKECVSYFHLRENQECNQQYPQLISINKSKEVGCANWQIDHCESIDYGLMESQIYQCQKCQVRYILKAVSQPIRKCLKIQNISHCKFHKLDNSLNYQCVQCESGYSLNEQGKCMVQLPIPKCLEYLLNKRFCVKCQSDYYSQSGICVKRGVTYSFGICEEYFTSLDGCKKFKYQFNRGEEEIIFNPPTTPTTSSTPSNTYTGINGCLQYLNYTTCKKCIKDYYSVKSGCKKVEKLIPNCLYYDLNQNCQECEEGFSLNNQQCYQIQGKNCLVFKNANECLSCLSTYPLLNDQKICTFNADFPNCIFFSTEKSCSVCDVNHYAIDGFCKPIETKIENCQRYDDTQNCTVCVSGYFLWKGKCFQNPEHDINCEEFSVTNFECSICHEGYVLVGQECKRCQVSNCGICDQDNLEVCLMCRQGYWMNSQQTCLENEEFKAFKPRIVIDF